jgi:hypothetical protein
MACRPLSNLIGELREEEDLMFIEREQREASLAHRGLVLLEAER